VLEAGDTIIAAKLDRLFRSAADALVSVEGWKESGIDLIIAEFGPTPVTDNGISKLLVGLLACVADFEHGLIRERVISGRAAKRRAGGHVGGHVPFGYRKIGTGKAAILEPIPEQQLAIDRMQELHREGLSLRGIAARVKDERGFAVSHIPVRNALARRAEVVGLQS
jgi:DNA invertase Pin-like site-specific DNA recombinase